MGARGLPEYVFLNSNCFWQPAGMYTGKADRHAIQLRCLLLKESQARRHRSRRRRRACRSESVKAGLKVIHFLALWRPALKGKSFHTAAFTFTAPLYKFSQPRPCLHCYLCQQLPTPLLWSQQIRTNQQQLTGDPPGRASHKQAMHTATQPASLPQAVFTGPCLLFISSLGQFCQNKFAQHQQRHLRPRQHPRLEGEARGVTPLHQHGTRRQPAVPAAHPSEMHSGASVINSMSLWYHA